MLVADPDNPADANAVEVHVPSDVGLVGWLPRNLAARLSPCLLDGEDWQAAIDHVAVHPDHPDRPGIGIHVRHITAD